MVRFLPFLISLVLTVYALFSVIQTPDEDVPHLPKLVWIILIVFVPFAGPLVWLLMSRSSGAREDSPVRPSAQQPLSRPLAPDDDPDFLKSLDRYRDPRTTMRPPEPDEPTDGPRKPKDTGTPDETDDGKA
ncbi:PLD nuclease N-terminal domain-containing protein [Kribbella solani]|uniref:PLD nuclease N-terminal domain-containing protein n=1 Tax=Kribbella solani TaxID=236067 RepID=UPI0029A773FE|nr:PLD nuclease N-terminal domain-containing protein [Kribbella solani]MDX2970738.1 PLD nuclease N-terminal domain-containing protein [Kribbella solani]MDX3003376.1 PLD nuclease N-terminal domain-containing protein [Kribbella solani]